MTSLVPHEHAADLAVIIAAALWGLAELKPESGLAWRGEPRSGRNQNAGTGIVLGVLLPMGIVGAVLAAVAYPDDPIVARSWMLLGVGAGLMAIGVGLRRWAIVHLGQWFSSIIRIQDGQKVVRSGPYRWIRHPAYAGPTLSAVGLGLALGTWLSLAVCAGCFLAGYAWRIRNEEAVLVAAMGADYRAYQASTHRLIPGVW